MDQTSYLMLNLHERVFLLDTYGAYVAKREYYIYNITLYTLFGYFVEAWRFRESSEIARVVIQENQKSLELYLQDIDIEELIA